MIIFQENESAKFAHVDKTSFFTTYPATTKLYNILRNANKVCLSKKNNLVEIPYRAFKALEADLTASKVRYYVDYLPDERSDFRGVYEPPDSLYEHQREFLSFAEGKEGLILCDEQGLGKTRSAICWALKLKKEKGIRRCLVVCGVNGLKWNWRDEILVVTGEEPVIAGVRGGIQKQAAEKIFDFTVRSGAFFIITNIESLRNRDIVNVLVQQIQRGSIGAIVMDEAHKVKTVSAQQTKGLLKLQPKYRLTMTGTPIVNSPLDLYVPLRWIGEETRNFKDFKNEYVVEGQFNRVISFINMRELRNSVSKIMLRRTKKEILNLPDKIKVTEYVEMTNRIRAKYKDLVAGILEDSKGKKIINPMTLVIRLRQLTATCEFFEDLGNISPKFDRMEDILNEVKQNKEKIVVYSNWVKVLEFAAKRLKPSEYRVITGKVSEDDRIKNIEDFKNNDEVFILLGTIGSLGTGFTLTSANNVLFLDSPWSFAHKEQAEDRCHRIGTRKTVIVKTLVMKGTVDEKIESIIASKKLVSDILIDEKSRADFLNYLTKVE